MVGAERASVQAAKPTRPVDQLLAGYVQAARRIALSASEGAGEDPAATARDALSALIAAANATAGAVYLLDAVAQTATRVAYTGPAAGESERLATVAIDGPTPIARALRTLQVIDARDGEPDPATRAMLEPIAAARWSVTPFHSGSGSGALLLAGQGGAAAAEERAALQIAAEMLGQALAAASTRRDEARLRHSSDFLGEAARLFSVTLDLPRVLDTVARLASPTLGDWVVIYLREGTLLPVRAIHHADGQRKEMIRTLFGAQPLHVGEGVAGTVVLTGVPCIFRDFDARARRQLAPRNSRAYNEELRSLKSWICLPLMAHGRGLGALVVATERRPISDDELHITSLFAEMAAAALDNARLYDTERGLRQEAEAARAQLALVDRQKDEFLSLAAHELRTPLTSAQGFAQMLLRRARADDTADGRMLDGLGIMETQLRRIGVLLNELLDLSRVQTGTLPLHPVETDLVELVRSVGQRLGVLPDGERLVWRLPDAPIVAHVDRDRIEQVVINLVENALKYSPGGGEVTVTLEREAGEATLRVRDLGLGVPPEAEPRMFQRYYRIPDAAHQQISGLGIGLFVCREIAERHGGVIAVEQPDGPGARFVLRLPLAAQPPHEADR